MNHTVLIAVTLVTLSVSRVSAQSGEKQPPAAPVVVELFTSQGCSSCPPADKLLAGLTEIAAKHDLPIYCLSFHVDYWNSLGWRDPYSSEQFTKRQHHYAAAFQSQRVYTPQMIVNGETEFVGSRGRDAQAAIQSNLAKSPQAKITVTTKLSTDKRTVEVKLAVAGNKPNDVLNVALVQAQATNNISRGENSGRELHHVHVVRDFKTIPAKHSANGVRLEVPSDLTASDVSVIAYLQDGLSMRITGAAASGI